MQVRPPVALLVFTFVGSIAGALVHATTPRRVCEQPVLSVD
jgi:hypothetical protein